VNILVLKPCCIGDVLMTTPLVATLRVAAPEARIEFAVGQWSAGAVATNPDIDAVVDLPERGRGRLAGLAWVPRAAWRLRWRRYDAAFIPDRDWRCHLVAYLAGVPRRFGVIRRGWSPFLTGTVRAGRAEHDVDGYIRLAEQAGLKGGGPHQLKYVPRQESLQHAHDLVRSHGFDGMPFRVALYPGGGESPRNELYHKRWPPERYALVADRLVGRHGGGVILLGDESERELNFNIRNDIPHPVLDLTGRLDLDEMAAVMQLSDAVIANDTGPMQLAVAVGTPTVGLFGPTDAGRFGPYGRRHRAVQSNIWCGPCFERGGPMAGCGAACMHRITVRDVVAVLEAAPG
jgi:lipopolysaccharide heptosyltransferase II